MTAYANPALEEAPFLSMSERETAELRKDQGLHVVHARGLYWWCKVGYCRRTHFLAESGYQDLGRPSALCWGYHSVLRPEDADKANGVSHLHIIEQAGEYDEGHLDRAKRKHIHRCRRRMTVVRIKDPRLLIDQGWGAFSAAAGREGRWKDVTKEKYLLQVGGLASDPRRYVIGAMEGDILAGYLETIVVGDVAYLEEIFVPDSYVPLNVSAYLHFEAARFFGASGKISRVCAGPHLAERAGLAEFKRRLGFSLIRVPSRVWFAPLAAGALSKLRPYGYYRLTGRGPIGSD